MIKITLEIEHTKDGMVYHFIADGDGCAHEVAALARVKAAFQEALAIQDVHNMLAVSAVKH